MSNTKPYLTCFFSRAYNRNRTYLSVYSNPQCCEETRDTPMTEHTPVIVGAARTPTGKFLGHLASFTAPQLGAIAIREAVRRAGIAPEAIDEVIMGNVVTAGIGQAPAR